jgi:hypothetical protein
MRNGVGIGFARIGSQSLRVSLFHFQSLSCRMQVDGVPTKHPLRHAHDRLSTSSPRLDINARRDTKSR